MEFPSIEAKVNAFQVLIDQLPIVHQYLLLYLLDMLCLFSLCSEATKMDLSSLATAFAPVSSPSIASSGNKRLISIYTHSAY